MDRQTVFTKTAKGLMEATGKTSALSRDMRALLKEIDGKANLGEVQAKLDKVPEAKLQEAMQVLLKNDYIREFKQPQTAAPQKPAPQKPAEGEMDLDFTMAIPTMPSIAEQAAEEARKKAQAEAEARAKAEAQAKAKAAAAAAAAAARARAEAEARAKAEADARAKREAQERAQREAEQKARQEAEARAKAQEQARVEAEARARKEAEERARVEAELKAKLELERKAREEVERKAREEGERRAREAEEKARREADELRARLEEERKAREEAERKAREEAERERKKAEEAARREADELRAKLEEERKAREQAERRAQEEAERRVREEAERKAKEEAERKAAEERAKREAEEKAKREAEERTRKEAEQAQRKAAEEEAKREAEEKARREVEERARKEAEETERRAKEEAERKAAEERAKREAEEKARREAEERARKEAEEAERKAKEEAERKAAEEQAKREAEEKAKREAEERARKEAEEAERKAKEDAERERALQTPAAPAPGSSLDDLVKIETDFDAVLSASEAATQEPRKRPAGADEELQRAAEEQARRQEEQARREADERAKAEEKARIEAEEQGEAGRKPKGAPPETGGPTDDIERAHAEAQALLEAQNAETERHFAEMEKELEAEQAGGTGRKETPRPREAEHRREREEAQERARAAAAARAIEAEAESEREVERVPAMMRTRINWGKPVALGLFLLLVLGLVLVHFVAFDSYIPQFEKAAGAYLQQPVKIKSLHLSLVPRPHWRMDGVSVGSEGEFTVAQVNAIAELGSMFSDKKAFTSIELESPVVGEQALLGLLFGKPAGQDFKVASVIAKNAKLNSKTFILPALDAKISMAGDGGWQKIALETADHKTNLQLKPDAEGAQLEVETNAFSLPFHPSFILENFVANGVIRRGELRLSELKGGLYGGYLSGSATLKWDADWSLDGEVKVRAMDPARFVPALIEDGKLEGKAAYAMRAKSYDELFETPRLEGTFNLEKGALLGVDLGRLLQGGGVGGKTAFSELSGSFVREAGKIQLRQVHLVAGPVSAGGTADTDASKHLTGRFSVEIKSPVTNARANLTVSGTLKEPRFSR